MTTPTQEHPFIKKHINDLIEQWIIRAMRIKLKHYKLAKLANLTPVHFSRIINKELKHHRLSTIQAIEDALEAEEKKFNNKR